MTTSRLTAACDPTQWVQSLIAINVQVNKENYRYAIIKTILQGGLSTVTAVTCIPACGTEIIKLVGDISCKATGGAIRGVQYVTSPAWLESCHQAVSGRPSLSHRLERIVGQAFGLLISVCGIFLRDDWAIQQHQSLGNYTFSKTSTPKTPEVPPSTQASNAPSLAPPPPPLPPAKANPPASKSALKPSPQPEPLPTPDDTGSSPSTGSLLTSNEHAPPSQTPAGSEPPPDSSSAPPVAAAKKQRKGVRIHSGATVMPLSEPKPASMLDEIKIKGEVQAAKGEGIAAQSEEQEKNRKLRRTLSTEGKAVSEALTTQKAKVQRHQSAYFKGFDPTLGNLVDGKIILRDLAKDLNNISFSTDEQILSGTFGEYVLLKFKVENTPIKVRGVCVISDEDWGQTFTITIVRTEKDLTTGKDIILEAAISW